MMPEVKRILGTAVLLYSRALFSLVTEYTRIHHPTYLICNALSHYFK